MQQQPYPDQQALWLDNPVVCVHCGQVVAELPEPALLAVLLAHQCTEIGRWCA
jgi:hypothetical protein